LVGRKLSNSLPIKKKYETHRLHILFNKGFLFYAFLNIQLFFWLLFQRADFFVANDLDTLPAVKIASWIKRKNYLIDLHELFPEVPEIQSKPKVKKFWLWVEATFLPKSPRVITVCKSIADYLMAKYDVNISVVRNIPLKQDKSQEPKKESIPKILLYQGAVNLGRGINLMIDTLEFLPDFELWIIGNGDEYDTLKKYTSTKEYTQNVQFLGRKTPEELKKISPKAGLGLSWEENLGLNYYFALPNKLFDYIQAEIPVLTSDFPEMKNIVETYLIGETIHKRTPEEIAQQIRKIIESREYYQSLVENCRKAQEHLTWEMEFKNYLALLPPCR
jgi:glycosyltransferase involved in cell wall biosynthesis